MTSRRAQWPLLVLLAGLLEAAFLGLRWLHPLEENLPEAVAVSLFAGIIYLLAAFLACSWRGSAHAAVVVVVLAAIVFRATLFPLCPTLSNDLYRYQWEGRIQLTGYNPYLTTPDDPELTALRPESFERLPGKAIPTVYAPLTELFFWLAAQFNGLRAFKLLSLLFDLGTLLLIVGLLRLRGQPAVHALLYGWCPLVVVEFAGSGHNDSLALFYLLLANLFIIRQRAAVSIVALAAAVMSKWFAAVTVPVFLRRSRWWGAPLLAAAAAVIALPYGAAGWNLFKGFMTYAEHWRNNASLYALLAAATGQDAVATGLALGIVGGLALHLAWTNTEPLRASYLLLAAVLLLSPSVFPWYVTWLAPFLCFFPNPALLLFTVTVFLSYHVLIDFTALGLWHYSPWLVGLEYAPIYGLLLWQQWRARRHFKTANSCAPGRARL